MKITKLLSLDSLPAPAIKARAKKIVLTYAERVTPPAVFTVGSETFENALGTVRALEVEDVLVDEKGGFYLVQAAPEKILKVSGDFDLMQQAVYALVARGIRVAKTDTGFALTDNEQFAALLTSVGLQVSESSEPFVPVPLERPEHGEGCGCGCGHHHHHHHDEGECGCGCGHHHHHEDEECCCGHHHEDGECECGHHHHDEDEECCCGHHHEDGECGCGHHHHHEDEECCCGHHHEDGECECGHHHHDAECGCGHKHE